MEESSKAHKKFSQSKHAAVSLDSLLGVLSSAYGTEELDSNAVFQENLVDWQTLSVENFTNAPKKQDVEGKLRRQKPREQKMSVSTSTTSLKPNKSNDNDLDLTLVTIKSLESLKEMVNKLEEDDGVLGAGKTNENDQPKVENELQEGSDLSNSFDVSSVQGKVEDPSFTSDCFDISVTVAEVQDRKPICGFYVDDSNNKLIFDIQFLKKINLECDGVPSIDIGGPEITLNVTDITKQTKTCIKIGKSYLVSKLKYFTDVDIEFGLENLDVAIKCNLNVFLWVIQWVKADLVMCKPNLSTASLKHVVSIAHHLGVHELVEECLDYFHQNCKTVLETEWEIEDVFDDSLFLQLAKRFTHSEIDEVNDYFEGFKSKIYCSLIQMLADAKADATVGHYSSLSTIFQCGYCEKIMHNDLKNSILCRKDCNQLDEFGNLIPTHEVSTFWDISRFIELLFQKLNSWKLVYWQLWGICHYFFCTECNIWYPVVQNEWCPYHPASVEYFPINSKSYYPVGTYECCGEKAFKFNSLKPYGGCQFKTHTPKLEPEETKDAYKFYEVYKHFIRCPPLENLVTKRFVKFVKKPTEGELLPNENPTETFWWEGIRLLPKEKKDYSLIPPKILNTLRNRPVESKPSPKFKPLKYFVPVPSGEMPTLLPEAAEDIEYSSEATFSKGKKKQKSTGKKLKVTCSQWKNKTKKKKSSFLYQPTEYVWVSSDANKDNQDNQRDFEEIAMRNLVKLLTPEEQSYSVSSLQPTAGSYIRLENDWWQEHCGDLKTASTSKCSGTVVNRTFPLSWFRKPTT